MFRNNEYSGEVRDMATEEKNKQIQYELYIPAQFDEEIRRSLEALMEDMLEDIGTVHEGESMYKENGEIDHCVLRFSMDEGDEFVEEILLCLREAGVPCGAKLYQNGNVIAELGNLHHIHVVLDASLGYTKQFKRLDTEISKALKENNVVSGTTLHIPEGVAIFAYYVADKDLAMSTIEKYLGRSALGTGATIDVVDSGLTIHERFMTDIYSIYRGVVPDLWSAIKNEWKGISSREWIQLLRRYPDTPEGLSFLLNIVNGTYQQEYTSMKVTFPMFLYEGKRFYLLSARQMLEFDLHGRDVMNMDIWGPDVKPSQVRAPSKQRNLCLFATTGEGEEASRLYLDYNPTKSGHVGQVIYYDGDTHMLEVLAPSFSHALLEIMDEMSDNLADSILESVMEHIMNLNIEALDLDSEDNQLLMSTMAILAESTIEDGMSPTPLRSGSMGMVLLENATFDMEQFKQDLLAQWDIVSATSANDMKAGAAVVTKDVDSVDTADMEKAHVLIIDDVKVVIAPFDFAMPVEALEPGALRNYLFNNALDVVMKHTNHVAISIVEGTGNTLEDSILLSKLLAVATVQTGATAIYTNGVLYEADKYYQETENLRDNVLPMVNLVWVDIDFEEDGTTSLYTNGMEEFDQLNVEFLHCPWDPERAWNYILSVANFMLTSGKELNDGDSIGRTETEELVVHIDEPVHADGLQSIQIFFAESEEA
ncbi:DUF4261 domain-containing protein [Veillonella sp. CHU732]|uniref:DUF4261 domain-containing protein n=1 Tax=Veillonella sp. CHU732 TaxID=2490949 RepID=UPI0013DFA680|nr:DUF4261 domain-containing protein [Veillonella sp. CHU732]